MSKRISSICRAALLVAIAVASGGRAGAADVNSDRIVSVGGAVTEILYDLGKQDRIVGIDTTSLFPPDALRSKPNVGYMRQLSAEGVIGLNPSVVLAIVDSGPPQALESLRAARIQVVRIPDAFSEAGILEKIRLIGDVVHAAAPAACLTKNVQANFASLRRVTEQVVHPLRVMFILSLANGRILAAGRDTAANAIIELAGGRNAFEAFSGYKAIGDEAVADAGPDAVLVMQRGQGSITADDVFSRPEFTSTPAARSRRFIAMDGLYLLGFGPRTASAAQDLAHALYPALAKASAGAEGLSPAVCR